MSLLYLGVGRSVAIAPPVDHTLRRHPALELLISLEEPFLFRTDTTEWIPALGVAIDPGVPHQARELRGMFVSILVLPERRFAGRPRKGALRGGPIRILRGSELTGPVSFFRTALNQETGCSKIFQKTEELVGGLTEAPGTASGVDERLLTVLEGIQRSLGGRIRSKDLARLACLSENRFLHLFKEQLGITVRQYVGLQRIMRATMEILDGKTLTRAALNSGFADSSHFTRRFAEFSGYLPSRLKAYRGVTAVRSCDSSRCVRPSTPPPGAEICAECQIYSRKVLTGIRA